MEARHVSQRSADRAKAVIDHCPLVRRESLEQVFFAAIDGDQRLPGYSYATLMYEWSLLLFLSVGMFLVLAFQRQKIALAMTALIHVTPPPPDTEPEPGNNSG
jgi:hypothetical protein